MDPKSENDEGLNTAGKLDTEPSSTEPEDANKKSTAEPENVDKKESEDLSKKDTQPLPKASSFSATKLSEVPSKTKVEDGDTPIGPTLDLPDIIKETKDILSRYRNFLSERKTKQAMFSFYLKNIYSSLVDYSAFKKTLDNFFSHYNVLTADMYQAHSIALPPYGDYKKFLKDSPTPVKLDNMNSARPEQEVLQFLSSVVDGVYVGGNYTRSMHKVCRNISDFTNEKSKVCNDVMPNFPPWLEALERGAEYNDGQAETMFEILSYINFCNSGIN